MLDTLFEPDGLSIPQSIAPASATPLNDAAIVLL
jgi:hypothetical protein